MKELIGFLDRVIDGNGKLVVTIQSGNGNHLYLTEKFDGYDEHDDCIELYNYDNDMSLLIGKESVLSCKDEEFEIALGDATLFVSTDEEM